jgi:hypothetical protein
MLSVLCILCIEIISVAGQHCAIGWVDFYIFNKQISAVPFVKAWKITKKFIGSIYLNHIGDNFLGHVRTI